MLVGATTIFNPQDTYIYFGRVRTAASSPHFRGDIDGRANTTGHVARIHVGHGLVDGQLSARCQTEISDFHILNAIRTSADEYVLGFEVAVDNVEAVDMGKPLENLPE